MQHKSCLPVDLFYANKEPSVDYTKVTLVDRRNIGLSQAITLDNKPSCCTLQPNDYFYAPVQAEGGEFTSDNS